MSRNRIGPRSSDKMMLSQDGRTRTAKLLKSFADGLTEHVGSPGVPEQMLIRAAAIKATRLALAEQKVFEQATEADSIRWLSWSESLRRDLIALGLESRKGEPIDLAKYIRERDTA